MTRSNRNYILVALCIAGICGISLGVIVWQQNNIRTLHLERYISKLPFRGEHGTIVGIDRGARTITVEFVSYRADRIFMAQLYVPRRTAIELENAIREDGIIVDISAPVPISFSELSIGDAAYIIYNADEARERLVAYQIVIGNPFPLLDTR